MHRLTSEEITNLDHDIDVRVTSLALLARPRDSALIHLLRCYDFYQAGCTSIPNPGDREVAQKHNLDGLNHAVRWVFQFCPAHDRRPDLALAEAVRREAQELFSVAQDYSKIWDLMSMLHRGTIAAFSESDGRIRLAFASELDKELDIADGLIAGPYTPEVLLGEPVLTSALCEAIVTKVRIHHDDCVGIRYRVSDDLFAQASERVKRLTESKWELDPSWDLGGYSIGAFHQFCVALDALCLIHEIVSFSQTEETKRFESIIRFMNADDWHLELIKRSGLSRETVSAIMKDLVYDPLLHLPERGRSPAHVTFQPFFPLGRNILGVSNWLVHTSNSERNAWELVSMKRPSLHSRLRNLKEETWIRELESRLTPLGIRLFTHIQFSFEGKKSEIDLLLLHPASRFGLVCQLKWLTIPGRIAQSVYNDREILKGIEQAKLSFEWAKKTLSELSDRIGLTVDEIGEYELKPLVLSKNYLASGFLRDPSIPVLNERLFYWVIDEPHHKSLRAVWRVAEELRYLPTKARHFDDCDASVGFGGIEFILEGLAYILKEPWDPTKDIDVNGLT